MKCSEAGEASFHLSLATEIQKGRVDCVSYGEPLVDAKRVPGEARTRAPTMCGPSADLWPVKAACSARGPPGARSPEAPGARTAWTTPPSTPRGRARPVPTTPPPLRRQGLANEPLMRGLERNSLKQVRLAIEESPEAAKEPFWEPRFEWPLCAAIRLGCSEEIVRLLIENGAKVHVTSVDGQSPLQLLTGTGKNTFTDDPFMNMMEIPRMDEWTDQVRQSVVQFELGVATALLDSGADPGAIHGDPGRGHCSSLEIARRSEKDHLVDLYETHGHQQRI